MSPLASWLVVGGAFIVGAGLASLFCRAVARGLDSPATPPVRGHAPESWRECSWCDVTILHGGTHECRTNVEQLRRRAR